MEGVLSTEDYGLKAVRTRRPRATLAFRDWIARRRTSAVVRAGFSVFAAAIDACVITLSSVLVGVAYHALVYHVGGVTGEFTELGLFIGLLFVTFNVVRHEYEIAIYLSFSGHVRRVLFVWTISVLTALVFIFVTKASQEYSRVTFGLIYMIGLMVVIVARAMLVTKIKASAVVGKISAIRAVLVGTETEIRDFTARYRPWLFGIDVVASFVLRGRETMADDIALAAASARVLRPDDIFVLLPWSETDAIDTCVASLVKVPASIHLGPQRILDRFSTIGISRIGAIYSLQLVRRPLTIVEIVLKRVFDLALAIPLIIGLAPVFLIIAAAIKIDSRGPILFLQRRYGFNQETFRILKFRSMSVREDDRLLIAATRGDPRVTRVGRFMRRFNIDELPQLLNVVRGDMSLVGPRPHALVHNQQYERTIAEYARRHNVRPGITGWAQIHGLRGEVTSVEIMRRRLQHDLYYIDNWSVGLDLRILAMTLLSPKAFANAY